MRMAFTFDAKSGYDSLLYSITGTSVTVSLAAGSGGVGAGSGVTAFNLAIDSSERSICSAAVNRSRIRTAACASARASSNRL
jgi:hypothetical protein